MKRQITIYESAQNGKITVFNDVECNTLSELKTLLRQKDINYNDMEFIEGVTNTKLISDDSQIPTNIPFKGKVTNNVFINILKKDSKISSGVDFSEMSRGDLLKAAKEFANEIHDLFGKNFTQVKSCDLVDFLISVYDEHEPTMEEDNYEEIPVVDAIVTMIRTMKCEEAVLEALTAGKECEKDDANQSAFSAEDIASFINK